MVRFWLVCCTSREDLESQQWEAVSVALRSPFFGSGESGHYLHEMLLMGSSRADPRPKRKKPASHSIVSIRRRTEAIEVQELSPDKVLWYLDQPGIQGVRTNLSDYPPEVLQILEVTENASLKRSASLKIVRKCASHFLRKKSV